MLVTKLLLGIIIVVLFAILDRLGDIFYTQNEEHTMTVTAMTPNQLKELLDDTDDEE